MRMVSLPITKIFNFVGDGVVTRKITGESMRTLNELFSDRRTPSFLDIRGDVPGTGKPTNYKGGLRVSFKPKRIFSGRSFVI